MAASVFISHSCKDFETRAPPGVSAAEIPLRAGRLKFALDLRNELYQALKSDARFNVFLDVRGGLNTGDQWRSGLHTALRSASAGIVLLSPEALESYWVLKEATILSWRAFMNDPIVLIPILLDVTREQLKERGFGALDLDAIQWITVRGTDTAEIARVKKEVLDTLDRNYARIDVGPRKLKNNQEVWIEQLSTTLESAIGKTTVNLNSHYLVGMCKELEIEPEDIDRFDKEPLLHVAAHTLMANDDQIIRVLRHVGKPPDAQRQLLQEALSALWVDPAPASCILAKSRKVIAINAETVAAVREYVIRAFCNQLPADRLIEPEPVVPGTDQSVQDAITDKVDFVLPTWDAAKLRLDIESNGPAIVILGPGSTRESILDWATGKYPDLTFVVGVGSNPRQKLGSWWGKAIILEPLLKENREKEATVFRNKLAKFVQGINK
jgi:hypothetical protein